MTEEAQAAEAGAPAAASDVSLIEEILIESKIQPGGEAYEVARQGVQAFISEMLSPTRADTKADKLAVDAMIAEIDVRLSHQLNEIMHHEEFQKLESAWRGLKFAIDRTDFRENVKFEVLNLSKDALAEDFEDAPDLTKSGLFRLAYSNEYGQFGGEPYGMISANYDFGPGAQDMQLLSQAAAVAAMSHAPFIANAAAEFFGQDTFEPLPKLKDIKALLEGPQYVKWHAFRENPDAAFYRETAALLINLDAPETA